MSPAAQIPYSIIRAVYRAVVTGCRERNVGWAGRRRGSSLRVLPTGFHRSGRRPRSTLRPADHLVEGIANLVLREVAVTLPVDDLLHEILLGARSLDLVFVQLQLAQLHDRVVDGVQRQHRSAQPAGRRVVPHQVGARLRGRSIAPHLGIQLEVLARAVRTCALVDKVPVIKRIAASPLLHIFDDERPVRDVVRQVRVGVQARQVAHGGRGGRIGTQRVEHLVAVGNRVLEVRRDRHQRRHDPGKVVVERSAHREAVIEVHVGWANRAAQVEAAQVGLGIELQRDRDQLAAHGAAGHVGLDGLPILLDEVASQRVGLRIGLLQRPSRPRVGALNDGIMALEEWLLLANEPLGDVKADRLQRIPVIEDHQRMVPVRRHVDAIGGAVEQADLGDACRRLKHLVVAGRRRGRRRGGIQPKRGRKQQNCREGDGGECGSSCSHEHEGLDHFSATASAGRRRSQKFAQASCQASRLATKKRPQGSGRWGTAQLS